MPTRDSATIANRPDSTTRPAASRPCGACRTLHQRRQHGTLPTKARQRRQPRHQQGAGNEGQAQQCGRGRDGPANERLLLVVQVGVFVQFLVGQCEGQVVFLVLRGARRDWASLWRERSISSASRKNAAMAKVEAGR
jgi:hypothetical protein